MKDVIIKVFNPGSNLKNPSVYIELVKFDRLSKLMIFHVEESQPAVNMSAKTRVHVICNYSFICFNPNSIGYVLVLFDSGSYLIRGDEILKKKLWYKILIQ